MCTVALPGSRRAARARLLTRTTGRCSRTTRSSHRQRARPARGSNLEIIARLNLTAARSADGRENSDRERSADRSSTRSEIKSELALRTSSHSFDLDPCRFLARARDNARQFATVPAGASSLSLSRVAASCCRCRFAERYGACIARLFRRAKSYRRQRRSHHFSTRLILASVVTCYT